jgi:ribonuclease T2
MKTKLGLMLAMLILPITGQATLPLKGYLIAQDECPALHSIRKGTNPGNVTLSKGVTYQVTGKNKANETHYLIKIEGEKISQRWVAVSCGKLLIDDKETDYLLAISWQPAFCQIHQQKSECITQTKARFDANHFTLHGLWPQPRNNVYCDIDTKEKILDKKGHWHQLPSLNLSDELHKNLSVVMPGVTSHLHRHEWIKHGTCYSDSPENYYKHSLALMTQINTSPVRDFIAENIGKKVTSAKIREKFDESFGKGAGSKVNVKCNREGMISELWINLQGQITKQTPLSQLIKKAKSVRLSCKGGLIDPVGF